MSSHDQIRIRGRGAPIATAESFTTAFAHSSHISGGAHCASILYVPFTCGEAYCVYNMGVNCELCDLVCVCGGCAWSGYPCRKPGMVRDRKAVAWNQLSISFFQFQRQVSLTIYTICAGVIAFGFGSPWTLPLYASLKGTSTLSTSTTKKNRHSFQLLSLISIGLAVALTLPLCFFAVTVTSPVSSHQLEAHYRDHLRSRTDHTIWHIH